MSQAGPVSHVKAAAILSVLADPAAGGGCHSGQPGMAVFPLELPGRPHRLVSRPLPLRPSPVIQRVIIWH